MTVSYKRRKKALRKEYGEPSSKTQKAKYLKVLKQRQARRQARELQTQEKQTKVYPNDPCPCGSKKKYKKCCKV